MDNDIITKYTKKDDTYSFFKNIEGIEDTLENHYDSGKISDDFFSDYEHIITSIVNFNKLNIYDKALANKIFNRTRIFHKTESKDLIVYKINPYI